jgi:DNA-binding MarR family transcriptional regulator
MRTENLLTGVPPFPIRKQSSSKLLGWIVSCPIAYPSKVFPGKINCILNLEVMTMVANSRDQARKAIETDAIALEQVVTNLSQVFLHILSRDLASFGVSLPQYHTLRVLQKQPEGCRMTKLATAVFQALPTMTGIVDQLVELELVYRQRDPTDRRSVLVFLTPRGEAVFKSVTAQRQMHWTQILEEFSPSEREGILRLITSMLRKLRRHRKGSDNS